MGLSIRAYARHRGVTDTAVHKAIRAGRITPEADGSIDVASADAQWTRNSSPARAGTQARAPRVAVPESVDAGRDPGTGATTLPPGGASLLQAHRQRSRQSTNEQGAPCAVKGRTCRTLTGRRACLSARDASGAGGGGARATREIGRSAREGGLIVRQQCAGLCQQMVLNHDCGQSHSSRFGHRRRQTPGCRWV